MKRRTFVKNSSLTAVGISAFGAINWNGKSFEGDSETTSDILGPFYRPGSPMRSNLIPKGSTAEVMHLRGTIFKKDGKTPLPNVLIESWQCDEHEQYDNASDNYLYRGAVKTGADGKYAFKTIIPVPYKDGDEWRPAHIHLRISSGNHQDLITQIYFKGDSHIKDDTAARSPQSVNRILEIKKNAANESFVKFDVVMGKSFPLNEAGYQKITGIYKLKNGLAEFSKEDDLLFFKLNGQFMEGLVYKGNNSFEGGQGFNKAKFEIMPNGEVQTKITLWDRWSEDNKFLELHEGVKILKYGN
ncbi:MAG: catechol 1,2-dioxygenase [Bacteroidota bacterium]